MKKRAAIAIDAWKLPIFRRHLTDNGYTVEQRPGVTSDTLTLFVMAHDLEALGEVVREAHDQCTKAQT